MPRLALKPVVSKHQDKLYRFTLTGRGKGNHKIVFDVVAEDGKSAIRLAREIIAFNTMTVEEVV